MCIPLQIESRLLLDLIVLNPSCGKLEAILSLMKSQSQMKVKAVVNTGKTQICRINLITTWVLGS